MLVVFVVLAATAGATVSAAGMQADEGRQPAVGGASVGVAQAENNTTQHEDPDAVDSEGDTDEMKGWLAKEMISSLRGSTLQLSQDEYQLARQYLGDDYNSDLDKYVDVAGDTAGSEDDETADTFRETQETQDEYVSAVQQYRQTREEYQEAKANGNQTRARRLARNLTQTADRVETLGGNLSSDYLVLENRTGAELDEEREIIQNTTQNITEQQREITAVEFVATRLEVSTAREQVSFTNPLQITGVVRTANGSVVSNESATIVFAGRTYSVRLDDNGEFSFEYRPVRLRLATESLLVRYRPQPTSRYLGSNTTLAIQPTQTQPTLTVQRNVTEVGYGDVVRVSGSLSANGTAVPRTPVRLALGNRVIEPTSTDGGGEYTRLVRIGASVTPGNRSLQAAAGDESRVIGPSSAETRIEVVETPTMLAFDATVVNEDRIIVVGRLLTQDGQPVPGQSVQLWLTEKQAISVTTNQTGYFQTPIRTALYEPESNVTLNATFDGQGTNLESATAETTLVVPAQPLTTLRSYLESTTFQISVSLGVLVALAAGLWLLRRQRGSSAESADTDERGAVVDATATGSSASPSSDGLRRAIEAAHRQLSDGSPEAAITQLYPGVRQYLTTRYGLPASETHWEFYQAVVDSSLEDGWTSVIRDLTESFEQVRYAERDIDLATVEAIFDDVEGQLETIAPDGGLDSD